MDFHRFRDLCAYPDKSRPAAPIETFARFQAGFLSSEDFHRISQIFMDFELLGLLGLLEGAFGFLSLLEGALNHVIPHARRHLLIFI